ADLTHQAASVASHAVIGPSATATATIGQVRRRVTAATVYGSHAPPPIPVATTRKYRRRNGRSPASPLPNHAIDAASVAASHSRSGNRTPPPNPPSPPGPTAPRGAALPPAHTPN